MKKAEEFEAETKSRGEELNALAAAKKIIAESTGGAASQSYGLDQVSFLQMHAKLSSTADLAQFEAVHRVRDLAKQLKSPALAQLSSRLESAMRLGSVSGGDIFGKIKGLISDMIEKLSQEADADATEKAFCDKELAYTNGRKSEKENEIAKLSTSIDQMSARSAQLKEEVAVLQKELADLAKSKESWDKFRSEENAAYKKNRAEMQQGLDGIKAALKVLRDYYAQDKSHAAADGAATGIVGLLEVVESDFSKGLAEIIATEESAVATHDQETKDIEIERATKEQDATYKTKEHVGLDKSIAESSSDRAGVQTELDAINKYLSGLEARCIAKAETYEEIVKRRTAEINGLKEALDILENEAASLLQTKRSLRGVQQHA
jgi:chromosome segregation ATPase